MLDGHVPLEAKQLDVGKGTLFKIVFENPEDRSKKVTVGEEPQYLVEM